MSSKNFCKILIILLTISSLTSCSSYRPILDQNHTFLEKGQEKADKEIDICKEKAEEYLKAYKARRAAKEAGRKAVIGAVAGSIGGAIFGRGLKSALTGAAIGAGIGALTVGLSVAGEGKVSPDHIKQRYVANCLARKGYSVIGWE